MYVRTVRGSPVFLTTDFSLSVIEPMSCCTPGKKLSLIFQKTTCTISVCGSGLALTSAANLPVPVICISTKRLKLIFCGFVRLDFG